MLFHEILSSAFTCGQCYYYSSKSIWQMLTSFTSINILEQSIRSTEFFIQHALFSKAQGCRKSLGWGFSFLFCFAKTPQCYHKIKAHRFTQCNRWQATEVATTRTFRPFCLHSTVAPTAKLCFQQVFHIHPTPYTSWVLLTAMTLCPGGPRDSPELKLIAQVVSRGSSSQMWSDQCIHYPWIKIV